MIVIGIIVLVMTAGIPLMTRAMNKNQLAKAINDTLEGCKLARDRAILQNKPYDFVIRNRTENDAEITVEEARVKDAGATPSAMAGTSAGTSAAPAGTAGSARDSGSLLGDFPRKLGDDVAVELVYVNMIDHMGASEARVRFFPNGTSDEFMVTFAHEGNRRTVKVDIITGAAWEVTTQ